MQCPQCGTENKPDAKFCRGCGQALAVKTIASCPACGAEYVPGAKFCKSCGARFGAPSAPPAKAAVTPASSASHSEAKSDSGVLPYAKPNVPLLIVLVLAAGLAAGAAVYYSYNKPTPDTPSVEAVPPTNHTVPEPMASQPDAPSVMEPVRQPRTAPPKPAGVSPQPAPVSKSPPPVETNPAPKTTPAPTAPAASAPTSPVPAPVTKSPIELALAECNKDSNSFTRRMCREKVRLQMCEGRWGKHPECPDRSW